MKRVTDANGTTHRLVKATWTDAPFEAAEAALAKDDFDRRSRRVRLVVLILVTIMMYAASMFGTAWAFVPLLVVVLLYELRHRRPLRGMHQDERDAHIAIGRCPACGNDLAPVEDGRRSCRSCNGVWNVVRARLELRSVWISYIPPLLMGPFLVLNAGLHSGWHWQPLLGSVGGMLLVVCLFPMQHHNQLKSFLAEHDDVRANDVPLPEAT